MIPPRPSSSSARTDVSWSAVVWAAIVVASVGVAAAWAPTYGLRAVTYSTPNWSGPRLHVAVDDSLSGELLSSEPHSMLQIYSIEWTGALVVEEAGSYRFRVTSDDGAILDIDDETVVNADGIHAATVVIGQRQLTKGVHAIRLRYFQAGGRSTLGVRWSGDGATFSPIPRTQLLPAPITYAAYRVRWWTSVASGIVACGALLFLTRALRWRMARAAQWWGHRLSPVLRLLERPSVGIAVIVLVGLVPRFALLGSQPAVLWPDSYVFHATMGDILSGYWASHDAHRTALYPFVLAAVIGHGETPAMGVVLVALQQLMGLAATVVFYLLGRRVFSPAVALTGATLFAVHSVQLFYEASVLTEALFTFALALTLGAAIRTLARPTVGRAALAGGLAAALVLVRPVATWYAGLLMGIGLVAAPRRVRPFAVGILCYAVPVLAWMAVNQREFGFFGVSLGRGMGLYTRVFEIDRLSPVPDTSYPELRDLRLLASAEGWSPNRVRDELNYARRHSSAQADDLMYAFAVETVKAHPASFAVGTMRQWALQIAAPTSSIHACSSTVGPFLCSARMANESLPAFPNQPFVPSHVRTWIVRFVTGAALPMTAVALLATVGALVCLRSPERRPERLLWVATIAYMTLVPAATQLPHDRFRLPVDAMLLMCAGWGARALAHRWPIAGG